MKFDLDFRPASEEPTQPGHYLLYNQCDGYHVAEAWFDVNGKFISFIWFSGGMFSKNGYCAWALLPDPINTMYDAFAKKDRAAAIDAKEEGS